MPFLLGVLAFENLASLVIHLIFRRTGRHLFLVDNDGKPPLLKRMIEDLDDCYFMYDTIHHVDLSVLLLINLVVNIILFLHCRSALSAFKRRATYSNVAYDSILTTSLQCFLTVVDLHLTAIPKHSLFPLELYAGR